MVNVLPLLVGVVLIFFGRRLFWLFVGAAGFIAGITLAREWLGQQSEWMALAIAVLAGLLGALLSLFVQKLAIALAGFLVGGYLAMSLASGLGHESFGWIAMLVGGAIGAMLVLMLFEWALILLSSLAGAALILQSMPFDGSVSILTFIIAAALGIVAQSWQPARRTAAAQSAR